MNQLNGRKAGLHRQIAHAEPGGPHRLVLEAADLKGGRNDRMTTAWAPNDAHRYPTAAAKTRLGVNGSTASRTAMARINVSMASLDSNRSQAARLSSRSQKGSSCFGFSTLFSVRAICAAAAATAGMPMSR